MTITINGSGTVSGVSVGGLPDGIVDTDMIAAGAVTAPKRGAGAILQVAQVKKSDIWYENNVAEGGYSAVVTGLTQAFQCSSASNKVLITGQIFPHNAVAGGWSVGVGLTVDGYFIDDSIGSARGSRSKVHALSDTYYFGASIPINYLYSANSTSSITYGIKLWNGHTSAQNLSLNYPSSQDGDNNNGVTTV